MRLFGRKSDGRARSRSDPGLPSTGHGGDDALLSHIASQSDIEATRHWTHYLYVADEQEARSVAAVVSAAGWQIQHVDAAAGDQPGWVVIAEAHAATTPRAVREARFFFEGVAGTHRGGDYDGWEVSL